MIDNTLSANMLRTSGYFHIVNKERTTFVGGRMLIQRSKEIHYSLVVKIKVEISCRIDKSEVDISQILINGSSARKPSDKFDVVFQYVIKVYFRFGKLIPANYDRRLVLPDMEYGLGKVMK